MSRIPKPTRERWQPLRLGLVDLFYYDQEEFTFRDGRLLLRGNNGTGKSKVLALTLPFLLDGDLSSHRVEPDADPGKRMEWNLLLGGEHPNDERLGYAWLEFGRRDAGEEQYCTIGCGLKAVRGRGIADHWFFVTDQRVGDLKLVDATRVALTAERLDEAIGAHGGVYRRARDYRRKIDERLFGLGDERYDSLVDLLIKIRAPQLSKRPDERGLSAALTGALAPLDQALIADVAEAFRALEDDNEALVAMTEARDAAQRYMETYRAYARMATRRRAAPLRQAQTVFDRMSRELAEAEEQHSQAKSELQQAQAGLAGLRAEQVRLEARRQALQEDPAARSAKELRRASEEAEQAQRRLAEAEAALQRAAERCLQLSGRRAEAEADTEAAMAALGAAHADAAEHAQAAGIGQAWAAALAETTTDATHLRPRAERLTSGTRQAIERLRTLLRRHEQAQDGLASAAATTAQIDSERAETTQRRDDALEQLRDACAVYAGAVRAHLEGATELHLPDAAEAFATLEAWLGAVSGTNPLEVAVAGAGREAARQLERAGSQADAEAERAHAAAVELEAEIARLRSGTEPTPPVPHTRGQGIRDQRAGAPLWQLVDFREDVDAADRAGIEAALEAAGILDGWVTPAGELLDPDTEDVLLVPAAGPLGQRLADALTTALEPDAGVGAPEVERLLDAIGLGESDAPVWVTSAGRFRNGVLRGAWHKPAAAFIGHAAREAARRTRIAELEAQLEPLRAQLARLERELDDLTRRQALLERELELPADTQVRDADSALATAEGELRAVTRRLEAARGNEAAAREAEQEAVSVLQADAADLGLPADEQQLDGVEAALGRLRETLAGLWPAKDRVDRAATAVLRTREDVTAAESERLATATQLREAEQRLAAAVERRDTLKQTAGAAIAELERKLAEVEAALRANGAAQQQTEDRLGATQHAGGAAKARVGELRKQLQEATTIRITAVDSLRRFATTGLIVLALAELELPDADADWNVTHALRLAREIEQALADDDDTDARWQRLQRQVTDELGALGDALRRHGNNAAALFREEGIVVEVTFRAHTTTLPELTDALSEELEQRQRLLDSREREILENHLIGEVASTLQELIVAAERRVAETNRELAERPTSTGMRLRLVWAPDPEGPAGLADARSRLLRQTADAWSEADRTAVGEFLQNQIHAVRAHDAAGSWLDHLTLALDYRGWHRFRVERHQANGWQPASGPASGGERVLAASVPLFAAASSYYSSAENPHAPRLVMLDEAFAGVDDQARAKCLGLLAAFDLDVMMTSEREWGCYAEVPGLAIAQLSRIDGIAAVLVTQWEWDGAQRSRLEPAPEPESALTDIPSAGPQLWDTSTASD